MSRWEEFAESQTRLDAWLVEVEELLVETPDSRGEVAEMKTFLERYKNISLQIQEKQEEVQTLLDDAEEFAEMSQNSSILTRVEEAESNWERLNSLCNEIISKLEEEISDFNEYQVALQDTEKWLLQISFQLMAENSLYICNREQTEEQIESHNEEVEEILEYQGTLDEVKNKGRKQIDRYIGTVPSIQDKIERQLHNIQESYNSLLATANHIQKRLNESLAKFEEYEATLESIQKNLEEWEPTINEENDTTIQSMEEAKYHLECTRVSAAVRSAYRTVNTTMLLLLFLPLSSHCHISSSIATFSLTTVTSTPFLPLSPLLTAPRPFPPRSRGTASSWERSPAWPSLCRPARRPRRPSRAQDRRRMSSPRASPRRSSPSGPSWKI